MPIPVQTGDDGTLSSPLELDAPDWKASVKRAFKEFKDDRAGLTAAGLAFYWFLAVFPALLAAVGFLGVANAGPELTGKIGDAIRTVLPGDAADVLVAVVDRAQEQSAGSSAFAALFGVVLALWSASAGMVAMQIGVDVAYDVPEERKFVKKRVVALELIVLTAVLGGTATALLVFGAPLGETLRDNLPFGGAFVLVWTVLRFALGLGALLALFASFYYLAPNRETPRFAWLSPGGLAAVLIWLAGSLLFSFYVAEFGESSYAKTYGSLAGVVVLILWLYLSGLAVMFGAELNAEVERQGAIRSGQGAGWGDSGRAPATPATPDAVPASNGSPDSSVQEWAERMKRLRENERQLAR